MNKEENAILQFAFAWSLAFCLTVVGTLGFAIGSVIYDLLM